MKNVLVVVDMQKDFIDGALGTKEAEAVVDKVELPRHFQPHPQQEYNNFF